MAKKSHTHKYHRIVINGRDMWACALSDCSHFMPSHLTGLLPGKDSICWRCKSSFVLDENNMKDEKPKCDSCRLGLSTDEDFDDIINMLNKE